MVGDDAVDVEFDDVADDAVDVEFDEVGDATVDVEVDDVGCGSVTAAEQAATMTSTLRRGTVEMNRPPLTQSTITRTVSVAPPATTDRAMFS